MVATLERVASIANRVATKRGIPVVLILRWLKREVPQYSLIMVETEFMGYVST